MLQFLTLTGWILHFRTLAVVAFQLVHALQGPKKGASARCILERESGVLSLLRENNPDSVIDCGFIYSRVPGNRPVI